MLKYNGSLLKLQSGSILDEVRYYVNCSAQHGTVTASPNYGINGTEVTLSNTPDEGFEFDNYSISGATLKNANQFDINGSNVTVVGNFIESGPSFDEVTIGTQTWMAKNLAIDDGGEGIYTQTVNYGNGNITEYYYTWPAAVRVVNSISGWHLPTKSEWDTLAAYVGGASTAGTKLKSTTGWSSGTSDDSYGFTAYPAGCWSYDTFNYLYSYANFWTSTETGGNWAINIYLNVYAYMNSDDVNKTRNAYTIRLIKDT